MARPIKQGLSYFPLDTDILRDRKVQRLILEYGTDGISVYLGFLCEIYGGNGYYLPVMPETCFDIGFTIRISESRVRKIMSFCLKINLFEKDLYQKKKILTSFGIQNRYVTICKQAKKTVRIDYPAGKMSLIPSEETPVSSEITPVFPGKTPVSSGENPTKGKGKEKENKKEKKVNPKKEVGDEEEQSEFYEENPSADSDAAVRRAELERMVAAATRGGSDA